MNKIIGLIILSFLLSANATDHFKKISASNLNKLLTKKSSKVYLFDANTNDTRTEIGIIPEAKLIEPTDKYDLKKDLPTDINSVLVFYCANERCSASHFSAEKAISLGYKNVSVMTDGIFGWKKSKFKLDHIKITEQVKEVTSKTEDEVTPQIANALVDKNQAIIVDVREEDERQSVIRGALWFPMSKADNSLEWTKFVTTLPKGNQVIFHCAAGFRSKKMAEKLSAQGYNASYFKGVNQWREAGLPLTVK